MVLGGGVVALYGGYQVIKGAMTLGSLTAIMIYITQMVFLLKSIGNFYETSAVTSVAAERLNEIFSKENKMVENKNATSRSISDGRIDFKKVSFAYKSNNYVLENLSFAIEANSKIAIIGPSGCGKSTLLSLILRLYDPQQGSIFIDEVDIKDVKTQSIKEQMAIVLQEPLLWNDSIKNNILYGKIDASKEEVINAAKIAQAHNFIMALPCGYDTIIGEMACNISEGQKQRIAISRAVIKRPKILILDEAMSSLDSETEDKVTDGIMGEFSASTIIVVSHLLSTVKKMEKVYFLNSPGNVMIGTHQELVVNSPKYVELFASQTEEDKVQNA